MTEVTPVAANRVSLSQIIELGVQKTYHDLTVLAELLPRKTDNERKIEIVKFAYRTRQLFIRLLALVKWAGGASKIEQCMDIVSFLDKQALLFINTADNMADIARTTLVHARLPPFQLPCAVEVLTLGTYSRMPTCVRDKIVPADPITLEEKRATIARLNHIIEQRLSTSSIHPSMRNLRVEYGRVIFHVENEFDLILTLLGDSPTLPWCVLGLDLLVEEPDMGYDRQFVPTANLKALERSIQQKMNESANPLVDVFAKLHNFCLSLQIEVLHIQVDRLSRERLANLTRIKEYVPGQELSITYWGGKYSLKVQTDQSDPAKPLKVSHQPELQSDYANTESEKESIFRPGNISIEQLITEIIQKRSFIKLNQLANELREKKYGRCTIQGTPTLLKVCCLYPCASAEELIISIDMNGSYMAHVPQYEKNCPLADDIQQSLNSNKSKLGTYFDQLKIWLTKKRCITTVGYLSVNVTESLPLCSKANHARLNDKVPRLLIQFNKYNQYYLMLEFFTSNSDPYNIDTHYSLLVTEPAPHISGEGLDIVDTDTAVDSVKRDLLVVKSVLHLDISKILANNYCYESPSQSNKCSNYNANDSPIMLNYLRWSAKVKQSNEGKSLKDTLSDDEFVIKQPVSLINEIPQIVSFCEEKLAHLALEKELRNRNFNYSISHAATSGHACCVSFSEVPVVKSNGYSNDLRKDTAVMTVCLHERTLSQKIWHCSYIFKNCPITTQSSREQSPRRFVYTPHESPLINSTMVSKFIDDTQLDWSCMAHLYDVVKRLSRDIQDDPNILDKMTLKSFNYKKLVIVYGPERNFSVTLLWKPNSRQFHLIFGAVGGRPFTLNPHSFMATHYNHEFNQHKSIKKLVTNLTITLQPLQLLQNLPVYLFFGLTGARPSQPAISFCLLPLSSSRFKLVWRNWHCLDIKIQPDGYLVVQDGSLSRFDRTRTVEDLHPIHSLEKAMYSRTENYSYILSFEEFKNVFQVAHLEQHLGMSFMIMNILKKLTTPSYFPTARALSPQNDSTVLIYASEFMKYRFDMDPQRGLVRMKADPFVMEEWRPQDIEVLEHYFETRIGAYPFKADPCLGFCRLLFNFPKDVLKDFIQIFRMELFANTHHMDQSVQWNIALCNLIPAGAPFMQAGMSSVCPLKTVTLFVLQLTRRNTSFAQSPMGASSIYVPFSFDSGQNTLSVYIPPRSENTAAASYLLGIDMNLKEICKDFRRTQKCRKCAIQSCGVGNQGCGAADQGCVIFHAIRQLLTKSYPWKTN